MTRAGTLFLTVAILLGGGCTPAPGSRHPAGLRVETAPVGADTRVTLVAPPHLKINARLKPALELADGTVLRFDSPRLTADSAYFLDYPTAILTGRRTHVGGTLRASVCGVHEQVCRSVTLPI